MIVIRFWGQQKYDGKNGKLIGYELFLRERLDPDADWQLPDNFDQYSASRIARLVAATLDSLPNDLKLVSFNLDERQFVDPQYQILLPMLQRKNAATVVVELTERLGEGMEHVTDEALIASAASLTKSGVPVCIDDVGTGRNQIGLVRKLNPYVSEYKFALQNVRGEESYQLIANQIEQWQALARSQGKVFAIEGFEKHADVQLIHRFHPEIVQGFYYGKPHLLPVAEDFVC